jgi:hypothetical protein
LFNKAPAKPVPNPENESNIIFISFETDKRVCINFEYTSEGMYFATSF